MVANVALLIARQRLTPTIRNRIVKTPDGKEVRHHVAAPLARVWIESAGLTDGHEM
jgi:hypothetical protein